MPLEGPRWPHLADRNDLEHWADSVRARSELPRVVRSLIRQTNDQVVQLEMRAAEGTDLPGYDGTSTAGRGTPFVPDGDAVWELGTSADPQQKANEDYASRTANSLGKDMSTTTFVFVTPREWRGKQAWMDAKRTEGKWRDVRAYDVDDIEQALEAAPAAHIAFSEVVGKVGASAQTVLDWWARFSTLSSPPLDPELVLAGRADEAAALIRIVEGEARLTVVSGASIDDVLAFVVASMLSTDPDRQEALLDRTLVVRDALTLRRLDYGEGLLILLPFEEELRREAQLVRSHHVILLAEDPSGADIALPSIDRDAFESLLKARGIDEDRSLELARAARHSVGAFQRRASAHGAVLAPPWTSSLSSKIGRRAWLSGRWSERKSGDVDALSELLGMPYEEAREELGSLGSGPDPLFLTVGETWTVASLDDAWRFGHSALQAPDLAAYEMLVQTVLGAIDPKLDLPISDRWMASVYGKTPIHSSDLREGVAQVLALIGARGEQVQIGSETLRSWLHRVLGLLFRRANEDLSGQLWASLTDVMPLLAEAAPDVFLQAVQAGLDGPKPLLGSMFADQEGDVLRVHSPHTGLLWALETVAWSAEHFSLAVEQLARLVEVDPGGHLSNRPLASLTSIFRPWMPQCTVPGDRRMVVLDGLRSRHNTVTWPLMLSLLPEHHAVGHYTSAPKFRDWRPEDNRTIPRDRVEVELGITRRLLEDASNDPDRWVELARNFDKVPTEALAEIVARLDALTAHTDGAALRAAVWKPLHDLVTKHQRFSYTEWAMSPNALASLDELQQRLAPEDPVDRVSWLFDEHLPDLPEDNDRDFDFEKSEAAVLKRRVDAVRSLWEGDDGPANLLRLVREAKVPGIIGFAVHEAGLDDAGEFLLDEIDSDEWSLYVAASGWARSKARSEGWDWMAAHVARFSDRPLATARLLLEWDDLGQAWQVAAESPAVDAAYWSEFSPYGRGHGFPLAEAAARQLLDHDRPRAALTQMNLYAGSVGIDRELVLIGLERLVGMPSDHPDQFRIESHDIERLLDYLRKGDGEVDEERLGLLEWRLRPGLRFDAHSPVLERRLAQKPEFFVEVLSMAFKPHEKEMERDVPPEMARNAYQLLDDWQIVPGNTAAGSPVDVERLNRWLDDVRPILDEVDRTGIGYDIIGRVLTKAPGDEDGTWPSKPVRDVIERLASSELDEGFRVEVFNSRGVVSRGFSEGGASERTMADKYSGLASLIRDQSPRTASILDQLARSYESYARRQDEESERFREGLGH